MASSVNVADSKAAPEVPAMLPGASGYYGWRLVIYDWWVLGVVNTFAWRCGTSQYLLPFFQRNVRSNHLDIGVGTGYYLTASEISPKSRLTLCDLSPTALQAALTRVGHSDVNSLLADCTKELPTSERFDSISAFYLFHCLPGPVERKTPLFRHIKRNMTADGVLTGATVLGPGKGVVDNWFSGIIRAFCKSDGIMDNDTDTEEAITEALRQNFELVETERIGVVLLWKAQNPTKSG